jgi:hypothetical protein
VRRFGQKIIFSKGDIILAGISYRHIRDAFQEKIAETFPKFELFMDKKETYAPALCRKQADRIVCDNLKKSQFAN